MGLGVLIDVWKGLCIADVMEQIHSVVMALSRDKEESLKIFEDEWKKILNNIEGKEKLSLVKRLKLCSKELSKIELIKPIEEANRITVTGEMYVRNEQFCRKEIEKTLADMGFITKINPLIEWHYYIDHIMWKNYANDKISFFKRFYFLIKSMVQLNIEKSIKKIFAKSRLYEYDPININAILKTSDPLVNRKLIGDVGITIGVGLRDSLKDSCGIISLGPFACIQTRMSEAILNNNMTMSGKFNVNKESVFGNDLNKMDMSLPLPYLAIESDGNPYPQIVDARLEVFGLQARRIGEMMKKAKKSDH